MKKKIVMLLVMAMTLSMAACGSQESNGTVDQSGGDSTETSYEGETLVVQVWGGTYEETMRNDVIPKFRGSGQRGGSPFSAGYRGQ